MVRQFYRGSMTRIKCSLKEYNITFPNATIANIRERSNIVDDDFKYISMIKTLDMSLCKTKSITDASFRYLTNIRDLNLQGACGHWIGGHHFTDEAFNYLGDLLKFYIDDNHVITNRGIKKLIKIKDLTIHNCSNIGDDGLCNLTSLLRLDIYNLYKLTDEGLKNLTNLEELHMTFGNITDIGISYLVNVKKIYLLACKQIKCKNFICLPKLEYLSLCHTQITDEDFVSLSNLLNISIYGCKINGNGLQYLTRCKIISIYESPIVDDQLDYLYTLKDLIKVNIYRCNLITRNKKNELKSVFGNKFNTD